MKKILFRLLGLEIKPYKPQEKKDQVVKVMSTYYPSVQVGFNEIFNPLNFEPKFKSRLKPPANE